MVLSPLQCGDRTFWNDFRKGLVKIGQRCYNGIDRYGQKEDGHLNERFYQLPEDKQNSIISAGFRAFSQYGCKNSPMSEIAAEAGISKFLLFSSAA